MNELEKVRHQLGELWGLNRPLSRVELARALKLSATNGGEYLGKLERNGKDLYGPIEVAIASFLHGFKPDNMDNLITPGYPRGPIR